MRTFQIQLTDQQITDLYNQISIKEIDSKERFKSYEDIKSYEDAREYLEDPEIKTHPFDQLQVIAKAINKLTNFEPDFKDAITAKWYPMFKISSSVWVFVVSHYYCYSSYGQVTYYKNNNISDYAGKQFLNLYTKLLPTI
jgi:hypothetical protein